MTEEEQVRETMILIEELTDKLGYPIKNTDYMIENLHCPHEWPKKLPEGYASVYMFFYQGKALKIGKANANSKSRFTSQHYRFNAPSTLAKSISFDNDIHFDNKQDQNVVKEWIKKNTLRINIMIKINPKKRDEKAVTELIEAVMHYKFRPRYEGSLYYNSLKEKVDLIF